MKKKVYVVPHSHWDREWYFSIEDSNTLLSENMEFLMGYLSAHAEFPTYCFDGQYSLIDEFTKYAPEKRDELKELIATNRIQVGPWYTQCDTLLIQTESIIRNLLLGQQGAKRYGKSMSVGYLPDIFGQNAYLPAIFNGFGLQSCVLQRGIYNEQLAKDLTFDWVSPNGEKILTNNLFYGYGPGKFLNVDQKYVHETLLPILNRLSEKTAPGNPILLPAGGDQVLVRTMFPQTVDDLNDMDLPYEVVLSDYESFMAATKNITETELIGELLASQKSRIHHTIRSQRVDIKLLNSKVEEKIYKQLEPLGVLHSQLGGKYPQTWINTALTLLFDAHAHDSIGGCNSDETNQTIINRLHKAERIIDDYINILKKQIARAITQSNGTVVVFNLLPKAIKKLLNVVVFTHEAQVSLESRTGEKLPQSMINQSYLSGGKQVKVTADGEQEVELPGYYRSEIAVEVTFAGFGYQQLQIVECPEIDCLLDIKTTEIENEFYRISLTSGKLNLVRKADGQTKVDWLKFENTTDGGDSYDYSPSENGQLTNNDSFELVETKQADMLSQLKVVTTVAAAPDLAHATQLTEKITIETLIELRHGSDIIQVTHTVLNEVKDHRVRVVFAGENADGFSFGDQGYSLQQRAINNPHLANWKDEGFAEAPQPIFPLERFVSVNEVQGNVTLLTKGLKEYEATAESLALTLYRSVGLLGRDNLAWRPGRASGINNKIVETPDAQMQGELIFDYGYRWHEGTIDIEDSYRAAERFATSQISYQVQTLNSFEERVDRFELPQPENMKELPKIKNLLTIQENLFFAAFKQAEEGKQSILRVFNPTVQSIAIQAPLRNQQLITLAEKQLDNTFVELKSKDFASIYVDF